mgnify:CR=1 FL=1
MPSAGQLEGPPACLKAVSPHTPRSPPEVIFHDDPIPRLILRGERGSVQASRDGAKASVFPETLDSGRASFGTHVSCLYYEARRPPGSFHAQPGSARGPAGMPQGSLASHPTVIPQAAFPDDPTPRLIPRARGGPRRHPGPGPRLPCSPRPWTAGGPHLELMFPVSIIRPTGRRDLSMPSPVPLEGPPACHKEASPHTPQASPKSSLRTTRLLGSSCGARGGPRKHPGTGPRLPCSPRPRTAGGHHLELMFPVSIMRPAGRRDLSMPSPVQIEG